MNNFKFNTEHSRIKNRSAKDQSYRNKLTKNLNDKRKKGPVGKMLADNLLLNESKEINYIIAKHGYTEKGLKKLMENDHIGYIIRNIENFVALDINEFINTAIDKDNIYLFVENLENLEKNRAIDYDNLAKIIISFRKENILVNNLQKFKNLSNEVAQRLIGSRYEDMVEQNLNSFINK